MNSKFLDLIGNKRVYWDGASGTLLQARGLQSGELPETWNLTHPDQIIEVGIQEANMVGVAAGMSAKGM